MKASFTDDAKKTGLDLSLPAGRQVCSFLFIKEKKGRIAVISLQLFHSKA